MVEREIILTSSYFSKIFTKDPPFVFIPRYFQAIMPYPGSPVALFFERSNIINFFDNYKWMCNNYWVDQQEKIKRLFWYCKLFTGKYIKTLISSLRTSLASLRKVLYEEYRDQDLNQQMNLRHFFEIFKTNSHSDIADVL